MKDSEKEDASLAKCLSKMHSNPGYEHPFGEVGRHLGIVILLSLIIVIIPMFLVTWFLSPIYFWLYRQKCISPKPFFNFDRHKLKNISFWDKLACEYCEFTNGTLQWMLAITNEIERRWCPVKNQCNPHCSKPKAWREDYLEFKHSQEERLDYYENEYEKTLKKIPSSADDN